MTAAKKIIKMKKGTKMPEAHLIKVDERKYFHWLLALSEKIRPILV